MIFENHCCSSQVKRRILLECKLFRFNKSGGDGAHQGHECRSITVGSTEHSTFVLSKLLLRAVSITDVPALEEIRQLLQQVVDGWQKWFHTTGTSTITCWTFDLHTTGTSTTTTRWSEHLVFAVNSLYLGLVEGRFARCDVGCVAVNNM